MICNLQACVALGQLLLLLGQLSHLVTVVTDGLVIDMDQSSKVAEMTNTSSVSANDNDDNDNDNDNR